MRRHRHYPNLPPDHWPMPERYCRICGEKFGPTFLDQEVCEPCSEEFPVCMECGAEFVPDEATETICPQCRKEAIA